MDSFQSANKKVSKESLCLVRKCLLVFWWFLEKDNKERILNIKSLWLQKHIKTSEKQVKMCQQLKIAQNCAIHFQNFSAWYCKVSKR